MDNRQRPTGNLPQASENKQNPFGDRVVNRAVRRAGWRVVRIWEHELSKCGVRSMECGINKVVQRIQQALG
jgi:hypothetical protein